MIITSFTISFLVFLHAQSQVRVSDLGNGKYKKPILYADYSDPDVISVGGDYYMTASNFNCVPILHSTDLTNYALTDLNLEGVKPANFFEKAQHGKGVCAPAFYSMMMMEKYIWFMRGQKAV